MTSGAYSFRTHAFGHGSTVHVLRFDRRKTNQMNVSWVADLDRGVTGRALLPNVLRRGTRSCPSLSAVTKRLEFLYGAAVHGEPMKLGERHVISLRIDFVNDNYLPAGESIRRPLLEFVEELITKPNLVNGEFPADVVGEERENHRRLIESLFNDKRSYARERALEEMCRDEDFRRYEYGSVEDLAAVTPATLGESWRGLLRSAPVHIYFAGDHAEDEIAEFLAPVARALCPSPRAPRPLAPLRRARALREVEDELDVAQAKLVLGFRSGTRFGDPLLEAVTIASGLLGQFPHSKLFLNVREAASLCYYAHSSLERTHGLMLITSGIDVAKRAAAQKLILEQVRDLQEGTFTEEDLEATIKAYDNRLVMTEDNPRALMDVDLAWRLAGCDYDHERYRERIRSVRREDVIEAARRWELDTVYLLRPRKESP